jgi:hypothetical protein
MKNSLLLSIVFLQTVAIAQIPDYFANNPVWRQNSQCNNGGGSLCISNENYVYRVIGDTLINDTTYKKIWKSGVRTFYPAGPNGVCFNTQPEEIQEMAAFLRQEGRKIFWRNGFEGQDQLIYNFELQVGDSLPVNGINFLNDIVVVSRDTILVNGEERLSYQFNNAPVSYYVEGIGHSGGFLQYIPPMLECGHRLHCYGQNDVPLYPINPQDECDYTVGIETEIASNEFSIYPNPAQEVLTIELNAAGNKTLEITNMNGQVVEKLNFSETRNQVSISALPAGVYFVKIQNGSAKRFVKF